MAECHRTRECAAAATAGDLRMTQEPNAHGNYDHWGTAHYRIGRHDMNDRKSYEYYNSRLTGRCKNQRKLENNTYLIRNCDGSISVRLHATDILTFYPDGRV